MGTKIDSHRAQDDHSGHRKRLRERFDRSGLAGFAEHEILELLLFYAIPYKDTKGIAKQLLSEFKSIEQVFCARPESLTEVVGVGESAARFLNLLREVSLFTLKSKTYSAACSITNASELIKYLEASLVNLPEEQFRVVFVDGANRIIKDEVLSHGVEDQTAVHPRQVMKRALALHATGLVVVHNHPTGMSSPSAADIKITRLLQDAAASLGIRFLDHVILGSASHMDKRYFSFRENGLLG